MNTGPYPPTLRVMEPGEISRIGEVDRSEVVESTYQARPTSESLGLELHEVPHDPPLRIPPWTEHDVRARVEDWGSYLARGGRMVGTFDGERLTGFALVGPARSDRSAVLVALFVDRHHRRAGMGERLLVETERQARSLEARALVAHSNPTASALRFYLKQKYRIIALADKSEVRTIDIDVVLARPL